MIGKLLFDILAFIGAMTIGVAVAGIGINWMLFRNWYGETAEQRRERIRRERGIGNRQ